MLLTDQLISWSKSGVEIAGFLAGFLAAGAVGFRYAVLRKPLALRSVPASDERQLHDDAARKAALLGLLGSLAGFALMLTTLPRAAARQHVAVSQLITHNPGVMLQVGLGVCAIAGFILAWSHLAGGWPLAATGVVAGALRALFLGEWLRLVNPVHRLAAGFWIGTLFVLVVAGFGTVSRSRLSSESRGRVAADMVNAFSPLALVSFALLVVFGIVTAWRHLGSLNALWSTPYGYALLAKLAVVGLVVALGAFNWRRQKPQLGKEEATTVLRRSATAELAVAFLVLVITAILVTLPAPSEQREQPRSRAPATAPTPR